MLVLRTAGELRSFTSSLSGGGGGSVGFVPTMGYLHEGHLSLVRLAREDCAAVIVSIFVNPMQFGPAEDLERYPRDEGRDLRLLDEAGADAVFMPSPEEVYPAGFTTEVRVRGLEDVLEGSSRPGHFVGVATVLAKLLNLVALDRMYLGQKDAQQAIVVRRMMHDLGFQASLVVGPTIREPDGLAMSSRNVYLSAAGREAALAISRALSVATRGVDGVSWEPREVARELREKVKEEIAREERLKIDYVSVADAESLGEVGEDARKILLSCAVKVDGTRLLDNVVLGCEHGKVLESSLM